MSEIDAGDNWQGPVVPWVSTPETLVSPHAYANFKECPACAAKPGSPELCPECLARRQAFDHEARVKAMRDAAERGIYPPSGPPPSVWPAATWGVSTGRDSTTLEREVAWLRSVVDQQARIIETLVGAAASRLTAPRPPAGPILPGAPEPTPGRPPRSPGAILAGRRDKPSREDLDAMQAAQAALLRAQPTTSEDPRQP